MNLSVSIPAMKSAMVIAMMKAEIKADSACPTFPTRCVCAWIGRKLPHFSDIYDQLPSIVPLCLLLGETVEMGHLLFFGEPSWYPFLLWEPTMRRYCSTL